MASFSFEYDAVNLDEVQVTARITASVKDWRALMNQLPTTQPACAAMREKISSMIALGKLSK